MKELIKKVSIELPQPAPRLCCCPLLAGYGSSQHLTTEFSFDFVRSAECGPNDVDTQMNFSLLAILNTFGQSVENDPPIPHCFDHLKLDAGGVEGIAAVGITNHRIRCVCTSK